VRQQLVDVVELVVAEREELTGRPVCVHAMHAAGDHGVELLAEALPVDRVVLGQRQHECGPRAVDLGRFHRRHLIFTSAKLLTPPSIRYLIAPRTAD